MMLFWGFLTLFQCCYALNPQYVPANYSQIYNDKINSTIEYIFDFTGGQGKSQDVFPPRVTITSENQNISDPLMVVARQPKQLLSWQLPMSLESDFGPQVFTKVSRTLCHGDSPIITISTSSNENISFSMVVDYQEDFFVKPSKSYNFTISPSQPRYYFYNFTRNATEENYWNFETVILKVTSSDMICMTVSIQNASCPVFDTNQDITFRGFYETVTTKGGITIPKDKFPYGFYVVFVVKPDDSDCINTSEPPTKNRSKKVNLVIEPSITYQQYASAVATTLTSIGLFYFIFIAAFIFCSRRSYIPRQMEYVSSELSTPVEEPDLDDYSVDETEYDIVTESEQERVIRLGKSVIYLTDLARKDPRVHKYKSYLYLYHVLTVALFYGLPVIQLVVTYQRMLNETGEQDICYYNFLCAHPLGVISDFNHVFSNSGYILFGILFLGITFHREATHKDLNFDRFYGIPQHYGMFYAMGVALIMEGVLSGSYHVCPNQANFQFDTSFMYVMAVLCMVKLYQNRHPDINATAAATFGVLALAILFGMVGILEGNLVFWIIFSMTHLLACLYLTIQIYYMGCWKLDRTLFTRLWHSIKYNFLSGPVNLLKPIYKARMCLLLIANLCNWAFAIWGVSRHDKDSAALFLLAIFMGNTLLYFIFYIVMKYVNKERVNKLTWFFLSLSTLCAISAMYFFLNKSISWAKKPAESRQFNKECFLLKFYDFHDIWHFLSAVGMFFTFMVLLTLDDDLSHTHRNKIVVF